MRIAYICLLLIFVLNGQLIATNPLDRNHAPAAVQDTLPDVLPAGSSDLTESRLRFEAKLKFAEHKLPDNLKDWKIYSSNLKTQLIRKTGVSFNHDLNPDMRETGTIQMQGYSIKNITFQTRPGIYATANLYIPDGKGPFPAVINMLGHWTKGKIDSTGPQAVGHSLAVNGYVCLTIDPWGSGERTTIHGIFEDHGDNNNLGSAVMNIGETLMGIELSDNIRGIDLLRSLPYVDQKNIGATGASGGGNQTMWLTAMDERIKAAMIVVSAGTFESYIMGSPCICEVMPDGLEMSEEAAIIGLIAPRPVKMVNHKKDRNSAFYPSEMLRTYNNASSIYKMSGAEENITYELFDLEHGYMTEDREALLGWFDFHLKGKGTGSARKEIPFRQLPEEKLMVFQPGLRPADVISTEEYCKKRGKELRADFLNTSNFDKEKKRNELTDILGDRLKSTLTRVHEYPEIDGWKRMVLETSDNKLIPVLLRNPSIQTRNFVIIINPEGKNNIPSDLLDEYIKSGKGIAIVGLTGTNEGFPATDYKNDMLRTISRSELWFGRTIMGEWVKEIGMVAGFLKSGYKARKIDFDGKKEAGLAGLFLSIENNNIDNVILRNAPVSYLFDNRNGVDYFSMGINLSGFLNWGDVSLAAALSGKNLTFINPVTISGEKITGDRLKEIQLEFDRIRKNCRQPGQTLFR